MAGFESWFDWWTRVPPASLTRRLALASVAGAGFALAVTQSLLYTAFSGPIPYKWIPDIRIPLLFSLLFIPALFASWGGAARRLLLLWWTLLLIGASAIDMMSVYWVLPVEGTLSESRVELVRVVGTLLALSAVLLLNADTSAVELRWALLLRGAPEADADRAHALLWRAALRRVGTVCLGLIAMAGALRVAELAWGEAKWGSTTAALLAGVALLGLGLYIVVRGQHRAG